MASNEETQELEILSLKSIYPDLFIDNVSSSAWKVSSNAFQLLL